MLFFMAIVCRVVDPGGLDEYNAPLEMECS